MKIVLPATVTAANLTSNVQESAPGTYNSSATYAAGARVGIVNGKTVRAYESLAGANTGNDPLTSPVWWSYIGTTYAEYSSATTYDVGDLVINATTGEAPTHRVYESLATGNSGNSLTDQTKWLDVGPTNRFAMFDTINGTKTTATGLIDASVALDGQRATGLALFGISGLSVQVTVATPTSGIVYDETYSLISTAGITDWYTYLFSPITYDADLVLSDLPLDISPTVRVQIAGDDTVECGTMILGQTTELGASVYGTRAGIQDYSRKEVDSFGNYTVVPRSYAKRVTCKVVVDAEKVDGFYQMLADLRTTPCVWIGADTYSSTAIFGFWKDYSLEITNVNKSYLSLEIEGLT